MTWHGSRTANWQSRLPAAQACTARGTRRGTQRVLSGTQRVRSGAHTGARHGTQRILQGCCGYSRYSRGRPLRKGCSAPPTGTARTRSTSSPRRPAPRSRPPAPAASTPPALRPPAPAASTPSALRPPAQASAQAGWSMGRFRDFEAVGVLRHRAVGAWILGYGSTEGAGGAATSGRRRTSHDSHSGCSHRTAAVSSPL